MDKTNIKVINETDNPLFKRKEVELEVISETNPSKSDVDKMLSIRYNSSPDKIRIKKIDSKFGSKVFTVTANIYDTREDMFKTERFSKKEKEKIKKAEEAPVPAEESKPEPTPTQIESKPEEEKEEPKEESKEEQKQAPESEKDSDAKEVPAKENKPEEKKDK